jgi:hypothetical protein
MYSFPPVSVLLSSRGTWNGDLTAFCSFKFLSLHCIIWRLSLQMSIKYMSSWCVEGNNLWNNCNGIYLCTTFLHQSYIQERRHTMFVHWITNIYTVHYCPAFAVFIIQYHSYTRKPYFLISVNDTATDNSCFCCCYYTILQLYLGNLFSLNLYNRVFPMYVRKTKEKLSSGKMLYIYTGDNTYIETPFNEFQKYVLLN